jgi:hypothetical protein
MVSAGVPATAYNLFLFKKKQTDKVVLKFTMVEPELAPFGRKNGFGEQLYAGVKY